MSDSSASKEEHNQERERKIPRMNRMGNGCQDRDENTASCKRILGVRSKNKEPYRGHGDDSFHNGGNDRTGIIKFLYSL